MNLQVQIIILVLCWVLTFFSIRLELSNIIEYQLNKNAFKKRKKGMTFKEWFLYTRYREEIPKILLFLYFFIVIGHPLVLLVFFLIYLMGPYPEIVGNLVKGVAAFDIGWQLILCNSFLGLAK